MILKDCGRSDWEAASYLLKCIWFVTQASTSKHGTLPNILIVLPFDMKQHVRDKLAVWNIYVEPSPLTCSIVVNGMYKQQEQHAAVNITD